MTFAANLPDPRIAPTSCDNARCPPVTNDSQAMTTYLLNSPVLTDYGLWRFEGPIELARAGTLLAEGFVSAIGHGASAQILSELLKIDIPVARIQVNLQPGDRALILRLKQRLPEGRVLTPDELRGWPHELGLLERLK